MKIVIATVLIGFNSLALAMNNKSNLSSLFKAVERKDKDKVLMLLKEFSSAGSLKGALEWQSKPAYRTSLLQATINNDSTVIKELVLAGADQFANTFDGVSAYSRAFNHGQLEVLKQFVKTPSVRQKEMLEKKLLDILRYAQPCHVDFFILFECFFNENKKLKYNWLTELAKASKKAAPTHEKRGEYIHYAPLYKQIAEVLISHNKTKRKQMLQSHDTISYWNILPSELRNLALNFYYNESIEQQDQNFAAIQKMQES